MVCHQVFNSLKNLNLDFKVVEKSGRFPEEKTFEFYVGYKDSWHRLLIIKFFHGRQPFYRKWIEIFSISPEIVISEKKYRFLNSEEERKLIECLSRFIDAGERIFIEYIYDVETWKALEMGTPPHLTRLGFMLLENGFTWFKDWYFPEGFMEGNPKIQAEKPVDDIAKNRHLKELCIETSIFAEKAMKFIQQNIYREIFESVYNRIEKILNTMCKNMT